MHRYVTWFPAGLDML